MSRGLWSRIVAQTGTKGHPLVPVCVTSRDQRPVQTNRLFLRQLRRDDASESIAINRASLRVDRHALWEPPAGFEIDRHLHRRRCVFSSSSLYYISHSYFHLKHTHLLILIFFPKHISHTHIFTTVGALSLPLNGGARSTLISAILCHH
jgi:hypothetical protein